MVGMRKSFCGFNRDDVVECIKGLHENFNQKESALLEQISQLNEEIERLTKERDNILFEKTAIENALREYSGKTAEIEQLTENIDKLYSISQTDSKEDENIDNNNIITSMTAEDIDKTRAALQELKTAIAETSENFTKKVNNLFNSLNEVAEKAKNEEKSEPATRKNSDIDIVIL